MVYSDVADVELYHFILPLRAHYLTVQELKPIVLLLGNEYVGWDVECLIVLHLKYWITFSPRPSDDFLSSIASIPMVFYQVGNISRYVGGERGKGREGKGRRRERWGKEGKEVGDKIEEERRRRERVTEEEREG